MASNASPVCDLKIPPLVSRLAPSPTGVLHLGNARTFLWAWLSARSQGGRMIMRIEDLETRGKPGVTEKILDDLSWLGLDWDEGPAPCPSFVQGGADMSEANAGEVRALGTESDPPHSPLEQRGEEYIQSHRRPFYEKIHAALAQSGAIYPCICTRADIAASQSAPHEGDAELRYPGTCRGRFKSLDEARAASGREPAWRLKVEPGDVAFHDLLYGPQKIDVAATVGDFVVAKAPDNPAYQLAVVADDIAMGVTEVVRGDDLIPSTARQILIYRALAAVAAQLPEFQAPPATLDLPRYGHAPLVVGPDGKRLAKRHGDARIASFRESGVSAARIVGTLARWSGLASPTEVMPRELVKTWSWAKLKRERVVMTVEMLTKLK